LGRATWPSGACLTSADLTSHHSPLVDPRVRATTASLLAVVVLTPSLTRLALIYGDASKELLPTTAGPYHLPNLATLHVRTSALTDDVLHGAPSLQTLHCRMDRHKKFDGSALEPGVVARLTRLTSISLLGKTAQGCVLSMPALLDMTSVEELDLAGCCVKGLHSV
jgi:hypothetical protein